MQALGTNFMAAALAVLAANVVPPLSEAQMGARSFASPSDAEAFLTSALPAATDANPKYVSPPGDVARRWLVKTVAFKHGDNGVVVSLDETFEDYRDGAVISRGAHQATFALDEATISLETTDDKTEAGRPAQSVMFTCRGAPCIHAIWDGKASVSRKTDIYVEDPSQRENILSAFKTLQSKSNAG